MLAVNEAWTHLQSFVQALLVPRVRELLLQLGFLLALTCLRVFLFRLERGLLLGVSRPELRQLRAVDAAPHTAFYVSFIKVR